MEMDDQFKRLWSMASAGVEPDSMAHVLRYTELLEAEARLWRGEFEHVNAQLNALNQEER